MKNFEGPYCSMVPNYPGPVKHDEPINPEKLRKAIIQILKGDSIKLVPAVYDTEHNYFYIPASSSDGSVDTVKMSGRTFEQLFDYPAEHKAWLWCYKCTLSKRVEEYAACMMHSERNLPKEVANLLTTIKAEFNESFTSPTVTFTSE